MKKIRITAASLVSWAAFSVLAQKAFAVTCDPSSGVTGGVTCASGNSATNLAGSGGILFTIINILIGAVGIISVFMIVIGAIQLTVSAGNQDSVRKAKDTILYAVIGVVIALLSFAIVNFVLARL